MNIEKNFKKKGLVHIKNFFTEDEINKIDKRVKEILNDKFEFIYIVNKKKVEGSFLSNKKFETLRNEIVSLCAEKDLKIKSLENFIEIKDSIACAIASNPADAFIFFDALIINSGIIKK